MEQADSPDALDDTLPSTQEEALFADEGGSRTAPAPLALYRRYRPDTFAAVIGQEHVTEPLQRALANNRVNHAYLFSGPRGCGKTTSARILARALNCELGPRPEPCGECDSCRDLATGGSGSIDVIEIDAASHGGVDDARDLRERAFFAPVSSRYKIYIVDEAHMVTTAGFNALLKLVEEPPPHVKFIFATTEPDKVIGTIRSRTHHYPFRLVPPRVLGGYLARLCEAEGIAVEPAVLPLVVRAGAGSVRDSLSVLDQLLGGAAEDGVSYAQATGLLGYTPDSLLDEMLDAFAAGDAAGVFASVDKVIEVGQDPRRFGEDLLRRLRDLLIVAAVPDALSSGLVDVAADQGERLSSQAAALGPGELTRAAEVIARGLTEMRGTTAPRLHLELMCARVLLPGADVDDRGLHARLDRLERRLGMVGGEGSAADQGEPAAAAPPAVTRGPSAAAPTRAPVRGADAVAAAPAPVAPPSDPIVAEVDVEAAAERAPVGDGSVIIAEAPGGNGTVEAEPVDTEDPPERLDTVEPAVEPPVEQPVEQPATRAQFTVTDVRRLWPEVLEEVKSKRRFTWILLSQNAQLTDVRGRTLVLSLANPGAQDSFSRGGSEDVLRDALVQVMGADLTIETVLETDTAPTGRTGPPGTASTAGPVDIAGPASSTDTGGPPGAASSNGAPVAFAGSGPTASRRETPATASWPATVDTRSGAASPPTSDETSTAHPAPATGSAPATAYAPTTDAPQSEPRRSRRPLATAPTGSGSADDPDAAVDRDDAVLEESGESHTALLQRHLGAQVIAEEHGGA